MLSFECIRELSLHLKEKFKNAGGNKGCLVASERCPQDMEGDITLNCFRLAGVLRSRPDEIADCAVQFLDSHRDVQKVEKIKAFVNVSLTPAAVYRDSVAVRGKILNAVKLEEGGKRILVEYSAPNTNKPQHLGHVRNNTLGMALSSLLRRAGNEVIEINLVNDRGIHICKSMLAYERFGNGVTPESSGIKGDHLVGDFYVKYNTELNRQIEELNAANPDLAQEKEEDLFLKTEIGAATRKMLQDWENNDSQVRALWKKMNSWVFDGFNQTYERMGIKFEHTYLESQTYLLGKDIIARGLEDGVFKKRDDGAVIAGLGKKLGDKVVLRSDGTSVYITQDIGTTIKKYNDYQPQQQIWVVGDEQIFHFKILFAILAKLGCEWADDLFHLAYGMVNLPSGKMKSREGAVVDADDLFDEMFKLAKAASLERYGDDPPADIDERSEIIAMGALKFMLLKFNPKSTIMFDPAASIKFEGDTGPYVQYACARISSIIRKAAERKLGCSPDAVNWQLLDSKEEKSLAVCAFFYPRIVQAAAEKKDCSVLVSYLLDLAKEFNRFYRECPVLNAENDELVNARIALCSRIHDILCDGLESLTIKVPEAM